MKRDVVAPNERQYPQIETISKPVWILHCNYAIFATIIIGTILKLDDTTMKTKRSTVKDRGQSPRLFLSFSSCRPF